MFSGRSLAGVYHWVILGLPLWTFLISDVGADNCTNRYPFDSCPRPGNPLDNTVCCISHNRYTCCSVEYLRGWVIGLIVIGSIFALVVLIAVVCCCCNCCKKKKRRDYVVIRDDVPQQQQFVQPGVIVVAAPPPPPQSTMGPYGYSSMPYPPSNASLPPSYAYQEKPTPKAQAQGTGLEDEPLLRENEAVSNV